MTKRFPVGLALLALTLAACSSGGGGSTATASAQNGSGHAAYPLTYQPKPGDLLYYTNASISYNSQAKHPWVVVINAKTRQIVAASEISAVDSSPHGLGISPDGTKLYMPAGIGSAIPAQGLPPGATVKFGSGVTVIDAVSLKPTQSVTTLDAPHHVQVLSSDLMMGDEWGVKQVLYTLDPAQGNTITHQLAAAPFGGRPYISFPSPDGQSIYMTVRPTKESGLKDAWISRVDLADWSVHKVADVGPGAVWTEFSRDGKFAYVTLSEEDSIVKVDLAQGKVVGQAPTGRGPYGAVLTPDESRLLVVSKGEGRGQRGGTFVSINPKTMSLVEERPSCTKFVCQPDHVVLSPDAKEFWISNNMGYVDVFDVETLALKTEITMPLLADPHGGVFVQYDRTGKGHEVMDIGGPHGGISPYLADNQGGIPTLAQALASGWSSVQASSPLALKPGGAASGGSDNVLAGKPVTVDLTMDDFFFAPKGFSVPAGAAVTVKISNSGQVAHNFTSTALGVPEHDVAANSDGTVQFAAPTKPGTYRYVCTFHPGMEGTVTVTG